MKGEQKKREVGRQQRDGERGETGSEEERKEEARKRETQKLGAG